MPGSLSCKVEVVIDKLTGMVLFIMINLESGANDFMFLPIIKKKQRRHYNFLYVYSGYIKHAILIISLKSKADELGPYMEHRL